MTPAPTMTVKVVPELPDDFADTIIQATRLRVGEALAMEGLVTIEDIFFNDTPSRDRVRAMLDELFNLLHPQKEN